MLFLYFTTGAQTKAFIPHARRFINTIHMTRCCLFFTVLLTCLLCCSCNYEVSLVEKYTGFWAETEFDYQFYSSSNEFVFTTKGHFGYTTTKGKFSIVDSVIRLQPTTDWTTNQGVLKTRLVYIGENGCIRDFDDNYYCVDLDKTNHFIEQREAFRERAKKRLFEVNGVKEIVNKHPGRDLRFRYQGITLIDEREYHDFQLEKRNENENSAYLFLNVTGERYLLNVEDNLIYKHHSRGDSISRVESLF